MVISTYRKQAAQRFADQIGVDGNQLLAAALAVWSNLNPQSVTFSHALSVAGVALKAAQETPAGRYDTCPMGIEEDRAARNRTFIAEAATVTEAVRRAATIAGVTIARDEQARAIADAACGFSDDTMGRRVCVHRDSWRSDDCRTTTRERMRRELYADLADRNALPAGQPTETIRYVTTPFPGDDYREVAEHDDWIMVVVDLMVPVRHG